MRCTGGKCKARARAALRKSSLSFAFRKSCARVVIANMHALMFAMICSSETLASHRSRAFARLTHWCFADQASHVLTVVFC